MKKEETKEGGLAIVTGASSGIGYELAKLFAEKGYDLIVCAEDTGLAEAGNAIRQFGRDVTTVRADLATAEGVDELYAAIRKSGRPIAAIAMNAGFGIAGKFVDTDLEVELKLVQLNIASLIRLTKKVLPDMIEKGEGRILYTSSIAGEMPGPNYAVYAASKAFVQSFAEAIRFEVKDTGVTVTALQPGATDTNFFDRAGMDTTGMKLDDPKVVAKDGYEALMSGKDHVVAGSFKNKVQVVASKFMTDPQGAKAQGSGIKTKDAH